MAGVTCKGCGRIVLEEHVDANGKCVFCQNGVSQEVPSEKIWADLGRLKDDKDV